MLFPCCIPISAICVCVAGTDTPWMENPSKMRKGKEKIPERGYGTGVVTAALSLGKLPLTQWWSWRTRPWWGTGMVNRSHTEAVSGTSQCHMRPYFHVHTCMSMMICGQCIKALWAWAWLKAHDGGMQSVYYKTAKNAEVYFTAGGFLMWCMLSVFHFKTELRQKKKRLSQSYRKFTVCENISVGKYSRHLNFPTFGGILYGRVKQGRENNWKVDEKHKKIF